MTIGNIFGPSPQVLQASNTLLRLAEMDAILSSGLKDRSLIIRTLRNLWIEVEEKLPRSITVAKDVLSEGLLKIGKALARLYLEKIPSAPTEENIRKCLRRMQKDVQSVLIPPLKKSVRGNKGPTFLIDYQRFNSTTPSGKNFSYVIKWTNLEEVACHHIFSAFGSSFGQDTHLNPKSGFLVPQMCFLDFEHRVHEIATQGQTFLPASLCSQLRNNFLRISEIYYSNPISKSLLMISQKIDGENLFDFAQTRYRLLNKDQKAKIFNRLGRLAMLDIVAGNLDRLIQIFTNRNGEYTLQDLEANLGNVMVVWSQESEQGPLLYAIDNGIETDLIENVASRAKYLSFLRNLFSSRNLVQLMAQNMVKSFQHALETQIDDVSTQNIQDLKKQFQIFSDDLVSMAYPAFCRGLEEIHFHLQDHIIPGWEDKRSLFLREYLKSTYPKLFVAVQERIDILKTIRNSR